MNLKKHGPAIFWTGFIFILLVIPSDGIPHGGMLELPHIDKLAHVVLFGVFVWLWCNAGGPYQDHVIRNTRLVRLFVISSSYGILMEFVQAGFTNRAFETWDIIADLTGASIAWAFLRFSSRKKESPYGNRGRNQN